jgi:uncharacterized protein (TIGR00369 family)
MDELLKTQVRHIFDSANFVRDLGMQLTQIEDEYCETILIPAERHLQQHRLIHAGVMATMADHTSGCAARGVVGFDHDVVSVEFKINFLRPQSPTVYAAGVASSAQARCWLSAKPKCLLKKTVKKKWCRRPWSLWL